MLTKQKCKKRWARILTVLLAVAVTVCFVPQMNMPVYAEEGAPAIVAGSESVLKATANTDGAQTVWYAGQPWRVISYDGTGNEHTKPEGAMTLLAAGLMWVDGSQVYSRFNPDDNADNANDYKGSILQSVVNGAYEKVFSPGEKASVIERKLEVDEDGGTGISGEPTTGYLWPLSIKEASSLPSYGFRNAGPPWWLRSPMEAANKVGFVNSYGFIDPLPHFVDNQLGVRPAFDLNLESVLFTSAAVDGKSSGGEGSDALTEVAAISTNDWKLTLMDDGTIQDRDGHKDFKIDPDKVTYNGDTKEVTVPYSGAATGENEYISALIQGSDGSIKYYGRIAKASAAEDAAVTIGTAGKISDSDKLYVFNEQFNGDQKDGQQAMTDYASALTRIMAPSTRWTGSGRETDPFVISDKDGWNALAALVKDGFSMEGLFFRLGKDIEVTEMVGVNGAPFSGSFDGGGRTLTFNAEDAPQYCAPFAYTSDAAFKNLHTAGMIKTDQKYAAGLIAHSDGKATVTNCCSSIVIESTVSGEGIHAGFVAEGGAEFEGCVFDGQLLGPDTTLCGGFLGWASPEGACSFKNCFFTPEELTIKSDMEIFSSHVTTETPIENCYFTKNIDRIQGKVGRAVTADEGITVGSEDPIEYNVSGIRAFETGLAYGNAFYAEKDETVAVTISAVCDGIAASAGTLTGEGTSYTLTMPDENVHLSLIKGKYHKWKDATCTEPKICTVCQATEGQALGHKWKDATCTEPKTCTVCEATEGQALGHAWGAWAPLDENEHQRVCDSDSTHIETADHEWDEGVVTKEPTPEEAGEKLFTCGVCGATRTEVIPVDDIPVDPEIPVIDTAELKTVGNFARKEMKIFFHTETAVTNYQIQYRMAGETDWQVDWSDGADTYTFHNLKKASLCEFRIAGFVALEDGSWVRGEWSDISYRYMRAVKLRSAKAGKKSIKLTWAKDKKGSGYQIKYFTDKSIHMADADTITIKGKKKTKYTIKQLQKGQTYYVRIRPIKITNGIEYQGILKNTKKVKVK